MSLLNLFRRNRSAPVARERLQLLLAYERNNRNLPDLVAVLREEIMAVIARHLPVEHDDVRVTMARGDTVSTLEIDIHFPTGAA